MLIGKYNTLSAGAHYFFQGLRLLWHPQLRAYILVPLAVNLLLFMILSAVFFWFFGGLIASGLSVLPEFLAPLAWLVWLVLGAIAIIVYGYSFNMITNILAAPFYGLLAEQAELILAGTKPPQETTGKMMQRVFLRELGKLWYFLSRGIFVTLVLVLIGTIPIVGIIAPLIGIAWGAWSMAIQYADYPADNHQKKFKNLRDRLWRKSFSSLGFGGMVMFFSIIPVVNIFAMPAAVTGGTIYWLDELRGCLSSKE